MQKFKEGNYLIELGESHTGKFYYKVVVPAGEDFQEELCGFGNNCSSMEEASNFAYELMEVDLINRTEFCQNCNCKINFYHNGLCVACLKEVEEDYEYMMFDKACEALERPSESDLIRSYNARL
jgi:hypothetical protein